MKKSLKREYKKSFKNENLKKMLEVNIRSLFLNNNILTLRELMLTLNNRIEKIHEELINCKK